MMFVTFITDIPQGDFRFSVQKRKNGINPVHCPLFKNHLNESQLGHLVTQTIQNFVAEYSVRQNHPNEL
jgi:hypothetical protein